jgi:methionyl-tRNA formyltransferase
MLKIAFFGGDGEGTMVPLEGVAKTHRVVALVTPRYSQGLRGSVKDIANRLKIWKEGRLAEWARTRDVPLVTATRGGDPAVVAKLMSLAPDVICVSAFPWILSDGVLKTAKQAAVNVHPSLLPRHRGPVPLFWIYHCNDRQTGVTVHLMNGRADAGHILAQTSFDIERGLPVDRLHAMNSGCAGELLARVLDQVEAGDTTPIMQDESAATAAPRVKEGAPMVDFQSWDVERVWHFLAGLCPRYREPLMDDRGEQVRYESVLGYELGAGSRRVGTAQRTPDGWDLHCRGGILRLGQRKVSQAGADD